MASYVDKKYIALLVFLGIAYLVYLILKPLMASFVWALIFTYLFYPVYKKAHKFIKNEKLAAFIVTFAIIFITIVSFTALINVLSKEIVLTYNGVRGEITSLISQPECTHNVMCPVVNYFREQPVNLNLYFEEGFKKISERLVDQTGYLAFSLPSKILELFIIFFAMFYLLIDGKNLAVRVKEILPMPKKDKELLFFRIQEVVSGVVYGYIVTAILIGTVASFGYYLFGLKYPVLLGVLTALASFIPAVSTIAIWGPASLFVFSKGLYYSDNILMLTGAGIFLFGIVFLSGLDNIVKTKIIGDKAKVHPAIILFGAFGGLFAFGLLGTFIGPLLLTIFFIIVDEYGGVKRKEIMEDLKPKGNQ